MNSVTFWAHLGRQVVLKATVEDQMGLQPASTPAVAAR